jgi:hypothetical protein
MVKFLAEAHRGVQGFVYDPNGVPIEKASMKIKGRDVGFQTTKYGEFWRILLPGVYKLEVDEYLIFFHRWMIFVIFTNNFWCFKVKLMEIFPDVTFVSSQLVKSEHQISATIEKWEKNLKI